MTTFIAKIETHHNGLLEFYFASIETIHDKKFFVTTIDKDTKSHVFYMREIDGLWRIDASVHKVQKWIADLEYDLALLILQKG
jgi:hypothetical protein